MNFCGETSNMRCPTNPLPRSRHVDSSLQERAQVQAISSNQLQQGASMLSIRAWNWNSWAGLWDELQVCSPVVQIYRGRQVTWLYYTFRLMTSSSSSSSFCHLEISWSLSSIYKSSLPWIDLNSKFFNNSPNYFCWYKYTIYEKRILLIEGKNQETRDRSLGVVFFFTYIFKKILTGANNGYLHWVFLTGEEQVSSADDVHRLTDGQMRRHSSHFLDNFACLFLGGAHFKHIVSTAKDTRHTLWCLEDSEVKKKHHDVTSVCDDTVGAAFMSNIQPAGRYSESLMWSFLTYHPTTAEF